jgi:hypothetical protein
MKKGLTMPRNRVPWYRWRFALAGVFFGGYFICLGWDSISDTDLSPLLRVMSAGLFLGIGVLLLVLEWRNREGIVFRMPSRSKDDDL